MLSKTHSNQDDPGARLRLHLLRNRAKIKVGVSAKRHGTKMGNSPKFPRLVCELEWTLSATEGHVYRFYLENARDHNVLWQTSGVVQSAGTRWSAVAVMGKVDANRAECAALLLEAALRHLEASAKVDRFYALADTGILEAGAVLRIAAGIWGARTGD